MVGQRLARDRRLAASKNELRIQEIWNYILQGGIQNLFDSKPCRIALIAVHCGYAKSCFQTLIIIIIIAFVLKILSFFRTNTSAYALYYI